LEIKNNGKETRYIISKNDLVPVALLYIYLANQSTSISGSQISDYYNYISNFRYYRPDCLFVLLEEDRDLYKSMFMTKSEKKECDDFSEIGISKKIGFSESESLYEITNIEKIIKYYKTLPDEIIHRSLTKNALNLIDVDRHDLKIDTISQKYNGSIDIYSMNQNASGISAINRLQECGYHDIRIKNISFKPLKYNHIYQVSYSAEKNNDVVELNKQMIK